MATPTGPAGGDLNGTYPNPGVNGLAAVIAQSAGNTAQISALSTEVNDLNTNVVNLTSRVTTLENEVTVFSNLAVGNAVLDGGGQADIAAGGTQSVIIAVWQDGAGSGALWMRFNSPGNFSVISTNGGGDAGHAIAWIAF